VSKILDSNDGIVVIKFSIQTFYMQEENSLFGSLSS
jgi:hypothetical protein